MESTFEMNCEGALAVIALVAIMMTIGLPFLPREEFIVVLFSGGVANHSSTKTWFRKPRRKPPDKMKTAIVAMAPISQLIVKYFSKRRNQSKREGKRERRSLARTTEEIERKIFKSNSYLSVPID